MIRVFVADDHAIVRQGITRLITDAPDMEIAGETDRGRAVLQRAEKEPWDVLVLDLSLEDVGGVEIVRRLRKDGRTFGIVVFSMYPEAQYGARMLKLGASAYLSKGRSSEELMAAIRVAATGDRYLTAEQAIEPALDDEVLAPHERLSEREHQIFLMVVEGRTPGDMCAELNLSPSTISTHLQRVREKIGARTNGEVVHYAYQIGLTAQRLR